MRFSTILAVLPLLLGAVSADYYVDCDDGKGHHEKYNEHLDKGKWSSCKRFSHGMKNFDCYQDDGKKYKFEFYDDDHCGRKRHDYDHGGKKYEHGRFHDDKDSWSYKVHCSD